MIRNFFTKTITAVALVFVLSFFAIFVVDRLFAQDLIDNTYSFCDKDANCGAEKVSIKINPGESTRIYFDFTPYPENFPIGQTFLVTVEVESGDYSQSYTREGWYRSRWGTISSNNFLIGQRRHDFQPIYIEIPQENREYTLTFDVDYDIENKGIINESDKEALSKSFINVYSTTFNLPKLVNPTINAIGIASLLYLFIMLIYYRVSSHRDMSIEEDFGTIKRTISGSGLSKKMLIIHFGAISLVIILVIVNSFLAAF